MTLRELVANMGLNDTWIEVNIPGRHSKNPVYSGFPRNWIAEDRPFYMSCNVKRFANGTFSNFPGQEGLTVPGLKLLVE